MSSAGGKHRPGRLIVLSAPSGTGKDTICRRMMETGKFRKSISATTRQPRDGEENGKAYFFLSEAEFLKGIDERRFLEYARVNGKYYGTPREAIEKNRREGWDTILVIDVQGGAQLMNIEGLGVITIFIAPPSWEELERRLRGRGSEGEAEIQTRLNTAKSEMAFKDNYAHQVVNDEVETAVKRILDILR